jgi:histidinol dehydrogenase
VLWADNSVTAEEAASSCIAQSEHDKNSMAILVTKSKKLIKEVKISMSKQLKDLPRKTIAQKSLKNNGALIYASSDKKILSILATISPEHVEVAIKNYKKYMYKIKNSGSVVLGKYGCMASSDYHSQHQLPTHGSAKYSSGLGVKDFVKQISYNEMTKKSIAKFGQTGYVLSKYENLIGHSRSIKIKMRKK